MIRKIVNIVLDLQNHGFTNSEILDIIDTCYNAFVYLFRHDINIDTYEFFEYNNKICELTNRLKNYGYLDNEVIILFNVLKDAFKYFKINEIKELVEVVSELRE